MVDGQNHEIGIDSKNWLWSECFNFQMMIGFVWNEDMFCHVSYCTRIGWTFDQFVQIFNLKRMLKTIINGYVKKQLIAWAANHC